MRYFRIPVFTGIEGHRNKPDRGTLRTVEGCMPYPAGALRSGPVWQTLGFMGGMGDGVRYIKDDMDNVFLVFSWDGGYTLHAFPDSRDSPKMGSTIGSEDVLSTTFAGWLPDVKMYSSNIGNRRVAYGNGGANPLIADMSSETIVGADDSDDDIYKLARLEFPTCTMFVRGPNKCLFGAGNPSSPLSVYVSEPAGITSPTRDSLYSTEAISRVDILLNDATFITALSVLGPYVVVHTDNGVTLLYGSTPDQAETGFRVEQVSSAVSSAAVSHKVVGGQQNQPFFLARDGQIYKDESTTMGPDGKPMYSDPRQISWKAKGLWSDRSAEDISTSFAAYDPSLGMYFVHIPSLEAGVTGTVGETEDVRLGGDFHSFTVTDSDNALSGPMKYPKLLATTNVPDSGTLIGLEEGGGVLYTDLEELRDVKFDAVVDPIDTTSEPGMGEPNYHVVATTEGVFNYFGRTFSSPFSESEVGTSVVNPPLYFDVCYLSVAETGPMHLSSEHEIKQLHEVIVSFKTNSIGYLWCYAENEDGQVQGQYKGSIYGKHRIKVFMNLRGREFKLRLFIVTHKDYPWQIQEVAIGHVMGKAYT